VLRPEPSDPVTDAGPNRLYDLVRKSHSEALTDLRQVIGQTALPVHSYFGLVAPCPALSIVARALLNQSARFLAPNGPDLPLVAAVSGFRTGGQFGPTNFVDIAPGPLLLRHAAELYPFSNGICHLVLTGAEAKRWLEHAARVFARLAPGAGDQPLIDPAVPGYQFDVLFGLTYAIDPTRPTGERIRDLRLADGTRLGPKDRVRLVTNSFRGSGGGGFRVAEEAGVLVHDRTPIRTALRRYLATADFDATAESVWTFAANPGTSAWFDSGRGSVAHLPDLRGRTVRHVGRTGDCVERFRIDL
jgi:2',3'-cyclic-nucleotide 2'-phosphodiesterase/3'-nucleotidase